MAAGAGLGSDSMYNIVGAKRRFYFCELFVNLFFDRVAATETFATVIECRYDMSVIAITASLSKLFKVINTWHC